MSRPGYEQAVQALRGQAFQGQWSWRQVLDIVHPIIADAVRDELTKPRRGVVPREQLSRENERLRELIRDFYQDVFDEDGVPRYSDLRDDPVKPYQAQIAELEQENERLRKTIAEYENCITWDVTCKQCARFLDESIKEHERAERAEAEVKRLDEALIRYSDSSRELRAMFAALQTVSADLRAENKRLKDQS